MFQKKENKPMIPRFFLDDPMAATYFNEYINYSEIKQAIDNIHTQVKEQDIKTLAVLSEFNEEGKSFFTATLCVAYSKFYNEKVLLIDTSTVKNNFSTLINHDSKNISNTKNADDTIVKKTVFSNFDVVNIRDFPRQNGDISEYQIDIMAKEFSEDYSLVVIDTTAFGSRNRNNAHPIVIAKRCDSSILIVSEISSAKKELDRYQLSLKESQVKLLGVIYNEGAHS